MAIDVLIKQGLFGRKTMPLEIILGERLHYGHYAEESLCEGELGETEFIAYNPESIGRGFSVIWTPEERKAITLRLPLPSTTQELKDFYEAIERMVKHWNGRMTVDGNRISLADFLSQFDNTVAFNYRMIKDFSQRILDGEHSTLMLYSAMWPLSAGKDEATRFIENPDYYAEWLHEKQSMDVYFASPYFYAYNDGIFGRYFLGSGVPTVFPTRPIVPLGAVDPKTGKQIECEKWMIGFYIEEKKELLCEMEYDKFLSIIPNDKRQKYDGGRFLLSELTEEEIMALSQK